MRNLSIILVGIFVLLAVFCAPVIHADTADQKCSNDTSGHMTCCLDHDADEDLFISSFIEDSRTSVFKNIVSNCEEISYPDLYCSSSLTTNPPPLLKEFSTLLTGTIIKRE